MAAVPMPLFVAVVVVPAGSVVVVSASAVLVSTSAVVVRWGLLARECDRDDEEGERGPGAKERAPLRG